MDFVRDCAGNGVKAVSFGGGEPLQYEPVFEILNRLQTVLFRSITTNGLLLDKAMFDRLKAAAPDKVHVSIHFPGTLSEVQRVVKNVQEFAEYGIRSGVNLLVQQSQLVAVRHAAEILRDAGISNDRIVYLPMRGQDTPSPEELAEVAGNQPFQSMTCLMECVPSSRFCSISWDRKVAWCSYTETRRSLPTLSYAGLIEAINGLGLQFCGGTESALQQLTLPEGSAK